MKSLPFPLQILQGADKHDVLELVVVKVAGSQGHDEVPEADQRRFHVSKDADDHVTAEERHGRLAAGLRSTAKPPMGQILAWFYGVAAPHQGDAVTGWMDGWMDGGV